MFEHFIEELFQYLGNEYKSILKDNPEKEFVDAFTLINS